LAEIEQQWKTNMKSIDVKSKVNKFKEQSNSIEYLQFLEDKKLFEQNAITKQEFLESKKRYLGTQVATTLNVTELNSMQQELSKLSLNKMTLLNEKEQQLFSMKIEMNTIAVALVQMIQDWREKNIILSTGSGRAFINTIYKPHANINPSIELIKLIDKTQEMSIKGYLPINSAGEVKNGQKVLMDIASYPANKFGFLEGEIKNVSDYPMDSVYSMQLLLTNGFKTTTGETLPNKPILYANGSIITKDISVLDRLFDKLKFKK
jgi:hypothetical protein